jgi:hypothetical protein
LDLNHHVSSVQDHGDGEKEVHTILHDFNHSLPCARVEDRLCGNHFAELIMAFDSKDGMKMDKESLKECLLHKLCARREDVGVQLMQSEGTS